jgi:hypothetical protein
MGHIRRRLTARGVKVILSRAGVDYSALTITDDNTLWTDVETGRQGTSVVISGPTEARRRAARVLFDRGFATAPYPDRDEWSH